MSELSMTKIKPQNSANMLASHVANSQDGTEVDVLDMEKTGHKSSGAKSIAHI